MQESSASRAWWNRFRSLLDKDRTWPSEYVFKFIVPRAQLEALQAVFGDHPIIVRASTRGRYVSVTARILMQSSADVVDVYQAAGEVPGVISL